MFDWITNPEAWVALFTLTGLEIVLGIDNIIVISILVSRLPIEQRQSAELSAWGWQWEPVFYCFSRLLG